MAVPTAWWAKLENLAFRLGILSFEAARSLAGRLCHRQRILFPTDHDTP